MAPKRKRAREPAKKAAKSRSGASNWKSWKEKKRAEKVLKKELQRKELKKEMKKEKMVQQVKREPAEQRQHQQVVLVEADFDNESDGSQADNRGIVPCQQPPCMVEKEVQTDLSIAATALIAVKYEKHPPRTPPHRASCEGRWGQKDVSKSGKIVAACCLTIHAAQMNMTCLQAPHGQSAETEPVPSFLVLAVLLPDLIELTCFSQFDHIWEQQPGKAVAAAAAPVKASAPVVQSTAVTTPRQERPPLQIGTIEEAPIVDSPFKDIFSMSPSAPSERPGAGRRVVTIKRSEDVPCRMCQELIPYDSKFCKFCGAQQTVERRESALKVKGKASEGTALQSAEPQDTVPKFRRAMDADLDSENLVETVPRPISSRLLQEEQVEESLPLPREAFCMMCGFEFLSEDANYCMGPSGK
ncbi:unnamed protein product [Symbiodinium sp. CCMP2592]|nr:unnamed protein product [Symbiodinium sp. CCMP2592]